MAWSGAVLKTFENMRKLDFFRLPASPRCAGMAAGAGSLKKSNFLIFSKVLRKGADQAIYLGLIKKLLGSGQVAQNGLKRVKSWVEFWPNSSLEVHQIFKLSANWFINSHPTVVSRHISKSFSNLNFLSNQESSFS